MGRALLAAIDEQPGVRLAGAGASTGSRWLGRDVSSAAGGADRGVTITADPAAAIQQAAVAIDFTLPGATAPNLAACVARGCPLVIGTTGHDARLRDEIGVAAARIPVLLAPNMSL